jgi:hypothetical protein
MELALILWIPLSLALLGRLSLCISRVWNIEYKFIRIHDSPLPTAFASPLWTPTPLGTTDEVDNVIRKGKEQAVYSRKVTSTIRPAST